MHGSHADYGHDSVKPQPKAPVNLQCMHAVKQSLLLSNKSVHWMRAVKQNLLLLKKSVHCMYAVKQSLLLQGNVVQRKVVYICTASPRKHGPNAVSGPEHLVDYALHAHVEAVLL